MTITFLKNGIGKPVPFFFHCISQQKTCNSRHNPYPSEKSSDTKRNANHCNDGPARISLHILIVQWYAVILQQTASTKPGGDRLNFSGLSGARYAAYFSGMKAVSEKQGPAQMAALAAKSGQIPYGTFASVLKQTGTARAQCARMDPQTEDYYSHLKEKYVVVRIESIGKDQKSLDKAGASMGGTDVVIAPNMLEKMAHDPETGCPAFERDRKGSGPEYRKCILYTLPCPFRLHFLNHISREPASLHLQSVPPAVSDPDAG